jgi:hypothetical protein
VVAAHLIRGTTRPADDETDLARKLPWNPAFPGRDSKEDPVPDAVEPEPGTSHTLRNVISAIVALATVVTAVAAVGQWLLPNIAIRGESPNLGTDRAFTLRNGFSGKCLDDFAFSTDDASKMAQYTCNGKTNQQWYWTSDRSIRNGHSGKCLDAYAFGTANGTAVVQYTCNGLANQHWSVVLDANGNPTLRSDYSGKCLDDFAHSQEDGQFQVIWQCTDLDNQIWLFTPVLPSPG